MVKELLYTMRFACPFCEQNFNYGEKTEHERVCSEINCICNNCGKNTDLSTEQECLEHLSQCFDLEYTCKYCGQSFPEADFEQHLQQICSEEAAK
jgi:hypothetical protein